LIPAKLLDKNISPHPCSTNHHIYYPNVLQTADKINMQLLPKKKIVTLSLLVLSSFSCC
jgi:hypothetical protein